MLPGQPDGERGQGLAEYALILSLIAIVAIAALAFFGLQISAVLTDPINDRSAACWTPSTRRRAPSR